MTYPRDMVGYGRSPPDPKWPGSAYVAVQFVVNYEEGGESNILHGDPASESVHSFLPLRALLFSTTAPAAARMFFVER